MNPRPTSITLLTNGLPPRVIGGMQTHSLNMARKLAECNFALEVFHPATLDATSQRENEPIIEAECSRNVRLHRFSVPRRRSFPGHYIRESHELSENYLRRFLAHPPTDLIYAKGLMASAFLAAKHKHRARLPPIVTNVHGYECFQRPASVAEYFRAAILKPTFRKVIQQSDFVVSYGGRITELLQGQLNVSASRILEIPGAVDDRFVSAASGATASGRRRFAFVGRYERRKGLEELAKALRGSLDSKSEFHVVGPVPRRVMCQFPQAVKFHGAILDRKRLIALLDSFDVLVSPSWSEGMPNVIMEAMARKCAIIATDVGATRLLVDNQNGRLVPSRSLGELRRALTELHCLSGTELADMQHMSRVRTTSRFTWSIVGPQLAAALTRIAAASHTTKSAA